MTAPFLTLEGHLVRLEPLMEAHFPALCEAAHDESAWKYLFYGNLSDRAQLQAFISQALERRAAGLDLPFAVIEKVSGRAVGCTRLRDKCVQHMRVEIGGTWYAPEAQRSGINLESKYLLLRHAFEGMGMLRVQFKTDARNVQSRQSLEKLGASLEGILRRSGIMPDGVIRDTAVYSILDIEWEQVKQGIETRLNRRAGITTPPALRTNPKPRPTGSYTHPTSQLHPPFHQ